jgi:hypothetical protein
MVAGGASCGAKKRQKVKKAGEKPAFFEWIAA